MNDKAIGPTPRDEVFKAIEHRNPSYVPGWLNFYAGETRARYGEALAALRSDQDYLKKGDVFTQDALDMWVEYKTESEVNPVKLRPHPHEFMLYYDI